jgi:hypothetical protein
MSRPQLTIYNSPESGLLTRVWLAVLLLTATVQTADAQEKRSNFVRLFRLDGTFGAELPARINSPDQSETPGFSLSDARLDADSIGFLTRLRSVLTMQNVDTGRRITGVEWQLDVYDEALRSLSLRVLQTDKVNIYPGETVTASAKLGATLPDRIIILFQLVKVSFSDGSAWSPAVNCSLEEDLRTVSCKAK